MVDQDREGNISESQRNIILKLKNTGNEFYKKGEYIKALSHYEMALVIDSVNLDIINNKRMVLIKLGRNVEAQKCQELERKILSDSLLPEEESSVQEDTVNTEEEPPSDSKQLSNKFFAHADWQPLPRAVASNLPICPICKRRPKWVVSDKFGWTTRGYLIDCVFCGSEWEYRTSDIGTASGLWKDVAFGAYGAIGRILSIAKDDSIWILMKTNDPNAKIFLGKKMNLGSWKQMVGVFCANCGIPLAIDEEFCPGCGSRKEEENASM